jgi:hypothetical protein
VGRHRTADADRHGIAYAQAIDVIFSPASIQVLIGNGPARIVYLGGPVGAAIVVTADREARTINAYRITEVRPATDGENRAWEKRQL